ncbi:MAG TPA: PD-(D/E)XK nuclease family protein, partial [Beijerinckiaceae bacterium]|nr:PD-(D/E)XK nuclease family protein [Beijerinckiaceae bacterium]
YDCAALAAAREAVRARAREEHNRLLYVAMTRARDRLVIAPYMTACKDSPQEAWCEMIRRGLVATVRGLILQEAPYGPVAVWHDGEHPAKAAPLAERAPAAPVELPAWLLRPAEPELEPLRPLRPSSALGAADWTLRSPERRFDPDARLRGALVHALLERLPGVAAERRAAVAQAYLEARAPRLDEPLRARLVCDALDVLAHEALKPLFGPGARAEAPIVGRVRIGAEQAPVSGQIDRFAVVGGEVLIADFKTTRPPRPDEPAPHVHLAQLALYGALMREIYPAHRVRAFLVWTAGPLVRELTEDEMDAALAQVKAA